MIKIPDETKRFSQPNTSDVMGNIWYSRNITFSEEGYIKLQKRTVMIASEKDDPEFDIPLSFGRYSNGSFLLVSADNPFTVDVGQDNINVDQDTGANAPNTTFNSWGAWWQSRWHASTNTTVRYRTPGNDTWVNTSISLSPNVTHPIEIFKNKNAMAIGNGNEVVLVDDTYSVIETLILPEDFEVVALKYSNNKMGIITRLGTATEGQNQDAFFFVWDGGSAEANGGVPVGSDAILALMARGSSWVIVTRTGYVSEYNGGGFNPLSPFPFVALEEIWGGFLNKDILGDAMQIDGEVFYLNTDFDLNSFGRKQEEYLPQNPAGVYCYDPKVGLYHTYSPSFSKATAIGSTSVDPATDIITSFFSSVQPTGTPVCYTSASSETVGGLTLGRIYYTIKLTGSTFKLALTLADALAGIAVDLTSAGSGTQTFLFVDVVDYGATLGGGRCGAIALMGDKDSVRDRVIFGGDYKDFESNSNYGSMCISIPFFPNIGYIVTPRISSPNMQDMYASVVCKFSPLATGEKIILKYKCIEVIGVPVTTPQRSGTLGTGCVWVSDTVFTTTADLSEIAALVQDGKQAECEIISGAGAGQLPQITEITEAAGIYTVTLAESVDGAVAGRVCNVCIDTWAEFQTFTSADTDGVYRATLSVPSKWVKIKAVMRGVDVKIEELQVVNQTQESTD